MYETRLIPQNQLPEEYVSIHTTDRRTYRRCRRKWNFASQLKKHLGPKDETKNEKFWLGTGIHFALEDYHGYNLFESPIKAFEEYIANTVDDKPRKEIEALIDLGKSILTYYVNDWLPTKKKFKTYWYKGEPQVEVEVSVLLGEVSNYYDFPVIYQMKFDRVVKDDIGRLWIMDYKTTASFDISKLETDPQINAYCWGFPFKYGTQPEGMIYNQLKKCVADKPKILKNGSVSKDKRQNTNYKLYIQTLKEVHDGKIPGKYKEMLDYLSGQETELTDGFIRYDLVRRTKTQAENEYQKIIAETLEMMDPDLALYPNPTRDCSWDCDFESVCLAMDEGSDYKTILEKEFKEREEEDEEWLKKIKKKQKQTTREK